MRSESSTVSDEEEQVVGSPMAQVTSSMPVLEPRRDPGPSRGLLIGVLLLLFLPRCRCFDLGKLNVFLMADVVFLLIGYLCRDGLKYCF